MVRLYAHRGASAELPENTLPAFCRALERGADALETDGWLTSDGHVVLSHDPTGRRMAGVDKAIGRCALQEVKRWDAGWGFLDDAGRRPFAGQGICIPTLDELLDELPGVPINLDLKEGGRDRVVRVLETVRQHRAEDRVLLASFSSLTLRLVRRLGYSGPTGLGRGDIARLLLLPRALGRIFRPAGCRAQVPLRALGCALATRDFIDRCHALGVAVDFWTVDDPGEARRLADLGADGVMCDDPRTVAAALGKKPGGSSEPVR